MKLLKCQMDGFDFNIVNLHNYFEIDRGIPREMEQRAKYFIQRY